jgi:hypothetical protein
MIAQVSIDVNCIAYMRELAKFADVPDEKRLGDWSV